MTVREFAYEIFADYHQFYIQDENAPGDLTTWDEATTERMFILAEGMVGIGTARNMTVPVTVALHPSEPPRDDADWDRLAECSIDLPSGRFAIAGCTDYLPDAARVDLPPGVYRVRIAHGGLETLSEDGLEGEDRYRLQLWPAPAAPETILKG